MAGFLKTTEAEIATQLETYANKIGNYKTLFGLTTAQVISAMTDAVYFRWTLNVTDIMSTYMQSVTGYKDLVKKNPKNLALPAFPVMPILPTAPTVPAGPNGVIERFTASGKANKTNAAYTNLIGEDLGIVGPEGVAIDETTVKPTISAHLVAGHPVVQWNKQNLEGVEIWKDNGSGTFLFVDFDPHPDWTDNSPLPAQGVTATWKYRAIYRENGKQVGLFSDTINVVVTGM